MNLIDLTKPVNAKKVAELIKLQFGSEFDIANANLTESVAVLNKTSQKIVEFKHKGNLHESQNNASYMKLRMLNEAAEKRATELTLELQESEMNKKLASALKIAATGGTLTMEQLESLRVSEDMQAVLKSPKTAQAFMQKVVESKKAQKIMEGEIDQAQTTIAAQDIADQIQGMIEKFADIKYKELPALHDSIRNAQGVDSAESFNTSLTSSLDSLTSALETAKADVNNAVAELTGQEVAAGAGDLDLDSIEGGEEDMDIDMGEPEDEGLPGIDDAGDDMDFDLDLEDDDEEIDLGRERR